MLPDEEVVLEKWRLLDGGSSLRLTHRPTGLSVLGEPSERPYLERVLELHQKLTKLIEESQRCSPAENSTPTGLA
jgi:hypothetical protein